MFHKLKNCRNGEEAQYETGVEITEKSGRISFLFDAKHTEYYCPHEGYNKIHSQGDACEVLIGSDPERGEYFEMEISPRGDLMLARITHHGYEPSGRPLLDVNLIDESFITGWAKKTDDGYIAEISFEKDKVMADGGEIYFNAYRLETEGGTLGNKKHLLALNPTLRPKFHVKESYLWLKDYVNK